MSKNSNLHNAKNAKNDEFYTRRCDIENELKYYKEHFKGKVVYCNCDDPLWSNFFKYFYDNIQYLGIKKLITTHYEEGKQSYKLEVYNEGIPRGFFDSNDVSDVINDIPEPLRHLPVYKIPLEGDGDFRSEECIEILKEADIVVTNEPFSLTRQYIAQLMEYEKKFLIIVSQNAITYKEIFPLIKDNKLWLGCTSPKEFVQPDATTKKFGNICWFTNLDNYKRNEEMILWANFDIEKYPMYDNYCAFNVDKCAEIPMNDEIIITVDEEKLEQMKSVYGDDLEELGNGKVKITRPIWGTPITVLNSFSPKQFEIVSFRKGSDDKDLVFTRERESSTVLSYPCTTSIAGMIKNAEGKINGKPTYARITIRRK